MAVFKEITDFILSLKMEKLSEDRKQSLQPLVDLISEKMRRDEPIRLQFICTHNSQRSHLSQIWAQTMAHYFTLKNVFCYSGGTEVTAVYPMILETLKRSGFRIHPLCKGENPVHSIKYAENEPSVIGFSKKIEDPFNPQSNFAAIMTCTEAAADCPFVAGAEIRISLPFEDPKRFDHTPKQALEYMKRNTQIATELLYVFSQIN